MVNPYKSPSVPLAANDQSSGNDEIKLGVSLIAKFIYLLMSLFYLVGAFYIFRTLWSPTPYTWLKLFPLIPGCGCLFTSFMLVYGMLDKVTLSNDGIEMKGFRSEFIAWDQVLRWRQKTEASPVQLELKNGRKRYLNNVGLSRDNPRIALYVDQRVGKETQLL